jgi:hypothetical protein
MDRRMNAVVSRDACTTLCCVSIALIFRVSCPFTMIYFSKTLILLLYGAAISLSMRFYFVRLKNVLHLIVFFTMDDESSKLEYCLIA